MKILTSKLMDIEFLLILVLNNFSTREWVSSTTSSAEIHLSSNVLSSRNGILHALKKLRNQVRKKWKKKNLSKRRWKRKIAKMLLLTMPDTYPHSDSISQNATNGPELIKSYPKKNFLNFA